MDLDHVAIGLHDVGPAFDALVGRLGAHVLHGGATAGFRNVQVRLGDPDAPVGDPRRGMVVELLEPWEVEQFDFLARFLARHGDGPHHLTFKVHDIRAELARLRSHGIEPVGERLENPWWREAFVLPKQAFGTVVQIAQSDFDPGLLEGETGGWEERPWWPAPPRRGEPGATLCRVVLAVPELDPALAFYRDALRGARSGGGDEPVRWAELVWPGGGRVRLEERPGRPGGIDRLECRRAGPAEHLDIGGARFELEPA